MPFCPRGSGPDRGSTDDPFPGPVAPQRERRSTVHGEYKTPGGKLIAVDFEIEEDKLRDARLTGDFFLYPEEALGALTAALDGLSVELSESEIAEQVRAAMPRDAELLGSSPEAIGAAVRRALAADGGTDGDA